MRNHFHLIACICCWLLFSCTSIAQDLVEIEERLAWEFNSDLPMDYSLALTPEITVNTLHSDVHAVTLFTSGAWRRVIRLAFADTIILIGVPDYDPEYDKSHFVVSMRYVYDTFNEKFNRLDFHTTGAESIFGDTVTQGLLVQLPRKPYFRSIDVKIYASDLEELRIELSDGDYGDATLIYTALSAEPQIIVQ